MIDKTFLVSTLDDMLIRWKKTESINSILPKKKILVEVTCLNEMRYTIRMLMRAIKDINQSNKAQLSDDVFKYILSANQYLFNGQHDITDALTLTNQYLINCCNEINKKKFDNFKFKNEKAHKLILAHDKIWNEISNSRLEPENREKIYIKLQDTNTINEQVKLQGFLNDFIHKCNARKSKFNYLLSLFIILIPSFFYLMG